MIAWKIDEDDFLELIQDRVQHWVGPALNYDDADAYCEYYEELVDSDVFSTFTGSIAELVDNDIINNTSIYNSVQDIMNEYRIDEDEANDRIIFSASNGKLIISAV